MAEVCAFQRLECGPTADYVRVKLKVAKRASKFLTRVHDLESKYSEEILKSLEEDAKENGEKYKLNQSSLYDQNLISIIDSVKKMAQFHQSFAAGAKGLAQAIKAFHKVAKANAVRIHQETKKIVPVVGELKGNIDKERANAKGMVESLKPGGKKGLFKPATKDQAVKALRKYEDDLHAAHFQQRKFFTQEMRQLKELQDIEHGHLELMKEQYGAYAQLYRAIANDFLHSADALEQKTKALTPEEDVQVTYSTLSAECGRDLSVSHPVLFEWGVSCTPEEADTGKFEGEAAWHPKHSEDDYPPEKWLQLKMPSQSHAKVAEKPHATTGHAPPPHGHGHGPPHASAVPMLGALTTSAATPISPTPVSAGAASPAKVRPPPIPRTQPPPRTGTKPDLASVGSSGNLTSLATLGSSSNLNAAAGGGEAAAPTNTRPLPALPDGGRATSPGALGGGDGPPARRKPPVGAVGVMMMMPSSKAGPVKPSAAREAEKAEKAAQAEREKTAAAERIAAASAAAAAPHPEQSISPAAQRPHPAHPAHPTPAALSPQSPVVSPSRDRPHTGEASGPPMLLRIALPAGLGHLTLSSKDSPNLAVFKRLIGTKLERQGKADADGIAALLSEDTKLRLFNDPEVTFSDAMTMAEMIAKAKPYIDAKKPSTIELELAMAGMDDDEELRKRKRTLLPPVVGGGGGPAERKVGVAVGGAKPAPPAHGKSQKALAANPEESQSEAVALEHKSKPKIKRAHKARKAGRKAGGGGDDSAAAKSDDEGDAGEAGEGGGGGAASTAGEEGHEGADTVTSDIEAEPEAQPEPTPTAAAAAASDTDGEPPVASDGDAPPPQDEEINADAPMG